jgi:hypothetical protein
VDLRAGLDDVEIRKFLTLPGLELRFLGRPARTQSLYRLRFPGFCKIIVHFLIRKVKGRTSAYIFLSHSTNIVSVHISQANSHVIIARSLAFPCLTRPVCLATVVT